MPNLLGRFVQGAEKARYNRIILEAEDIADKLQAEQGESIAVGGVASVAVKSTILTQDTSRENSRQLTRRRVPELNRVAFHDADSVLLQAVAGVGPVISSRIVKYRDRLGGFYEAGQLLEVYGMTEDLAGKVYDMFPFTPSVRKKLAINQMTAKELGQHPYIGASEAKVIYAYRNQHGRFAKPEDLLNIKIFTEEWLNRLAPYLEF
ncbi:MAG: helix-hairpin-helix domain-containing protein [Lunatimonas sp.]|uniref:ComEA family DNA-binding protein n=1 Tax=Lunatimonas sp. TaxID=2060141 RepID=UPI00263ABA55|nr:helix-hairpin-helix domain-containing protein [Lunatimonas sp.]MCC5939381.1 helix-hairpin-helix domain-containing protein [Lunatimonas sp.]